MSSNFEQKDIPQALNRALMQNMYAQQYFTSLTDDAKRAIIYRAASIISEEEMRHFINDIIPH